MCVNIRIFRIGNIPNFLTFYPVVRNLLSVGSPGSHADIQSVHGGEKTYGTICYRNNYQGTAGKEQDDMQMHKFYPEGNAEVRFKIRGVKKIFFYCNRDGLFFTNVVKGIDDKESGYDDYRERRELEKAVKMLFG